MRWTVGVSSSFFVLAELSGAIKEVPKGGRDSRFLGSNLHGENGTPGGVLRHLDAAAMSLDHHLAEGEPSPICCTPRDFNSTVAKRSKMASRNSAGMPGPQSATWNCALRLPGPARRRTVLRGGENFTALETSCLGAIIGASATKKVGLALAIGIGLVPGIPFAIPLGCAGLIGARVGAALRRGM